MKTNLWARDTTLPYYSTVGFIQQRKNRSSAHDGAAGCICWDMEAMGMGKICVGKSGGGRGGSKTIGIVLMAVGALVLLLFVPYWVWTSVLAILLISIGFLIWRFG